MRRKRESWHQKRRVMLSKEVERKPGEQRPQSQGKVCFCFEKGSLCIALNKHLTYYIDQAGLEFTEVHLSLLGLKGLCYQRPS